MKQAHCSRGHEVEIPCLSPGDAQHEVNGKVKGLLTGRVRTADAPYDPQHIIQGVVQWCCSLIFSRSPKQKPSPTHCMGTGMGMTSGGDSVQDSDTDTTLSEHGGNGQVSQVGLLRK